jgi:hypothetical protein
VPEDDDEEAEDEEDAEVDVISPPVLEVEAASLVVKEPPAPPEPPPPPPVVAVPVSPELVLSVDTVPDEAQPVLNTPKIKERVDPRTSLWRMIRDSAETRRVYKHLPLARPRAHVDARMGTLHHRRRLTLGGSTFCACFPALLPFHPRSRPREC